MKQINIIFLAVFTLLVSCSQPQDPTMGQEIVFEEQEIFTRGTAQKVKSKYYHLNSLASFERGASLFDLEDIANLADKAVSLVVLYDATAPWAEVFNSGRYDKTGDNKINELMQQYDLSIIEQFEIDDSNEGIVLEGNSQISEPLEAARKLSTMDYVLMVEVKESPATAQPYEETAEK